MESLHILNAPKTGAQPGIVRQAYMTSPACAQAASVFDRRVSASTRAMMTSRREDLRRMAQSRSDCPSRIDMTYTKRSNGLSARIAAKGLFSPDVAGPLRLMNGKLYG